MDITYLPIRLELMISQQFDMVKIAFNRIQKLGFGLKSSLFDNLRCRPYIFNPQIDPPPQYLVV
jgi:hypothetical protein